MTGDSGGEANAPVVTAADSPGFLLNQATLALNGSLDRALAPAGLTGAQWTVVFLLHEGRAVTTTDLARALGTDVAATWRLVRRLNDKGLVGREPDPADRRTVRLYLTDRAVRSYPAWRRTVATTLAGLLDQIPSSDLGTLNRALIRITHNAHHARADSADSADSAERTERSP